MENILFLAFTEPDGGLHKTAFEAAGAAHELSQQLGAALTVGLIGGEVQPAANLLAASGAKILAVSGSEFAQPRYATDAAAAEAICRAAAPTLVLVPSNSRSSRALPGVAFRLNGRVDTHVATVANQNGVLAITRWYYRQRMEAVLSRAERPWFLLLEPGCHAPYAGAAGTATVESVTVALTDQLQRTTVTGQRVPQADQQTIRPDAKLLFVAGAGWTKKQPDGQTHVPEAEKLVLSFIRQSSASLGSSKSLADQSGEGQAVFPFMTHLNQVGQTGATPRHAKGLSTCCHGEEPHVVGWRFVNERRAVNLDPNCGWARGKADVLYVADAFAVMVAVNALLEKKAGGAGA